jgi:FkbM family methyltransferase
MPGGYRLMTIARRWGWFNRVITYDAGNGVHIKIPLFRMSNLWDYLRYDSYESGVVEHLAEELATCPRPITLLDCGADIGLFSTLLAAVGMVPDRILGFEPNSAAIPLLEDNLGRLPAQTKVYAQAVSDFAGRGELCAPDHEPLEHSLFLRPAPDGPIPVLRIDDLNEGGPGTTVLKIDVEGAELNVLRGARQTLGRAQHWVVTLEAHRDVVARTGIDPSEFLRFLEEIAPCRAYVGEQSGMEVHSRTPFFEQVPNQTVCNIICVRKPSPS